METREMVEMNVQVGNKVKMLKGKYKGETFTVLNTYTAVNGKQYVTLDVPKGDGRYLTSSVAVVSEEPGTMVHEAMRTYAQDINALAQKTGARMRREGKALMGNIDTWGTDEARLAFTHGWMSLHESCECKISGGIGYTFDLAIHLMVKNPPARQYTAEEDRKAHIRLGLAPATWRGKRKASKALRVRSGKRIKSHR